VELFLLAGRFIHYSELNVLYSHRYTALTESFECNKNVLCDFVDWIYLNKTISLKAPQILLHKPNNYAELSDIRYILCFVLIHVIDDKKNFSKYNHVCIML